MPPVWHEKLLKGSEVYYRKTWHSVLDGTVPAVITASDFRNTYAIYGMCGIDEDTALLYWRIHTGINDSDEFSCDIESAIVIWYLRGAHVLVLDNAIIHSGWDNNVLEEWLWTPSSKSYKLSQLQLGSIQRVVSFWEFSDFLFLYVTSKSYTM
jgi:hypothetical protein